MKLSDLLKPKFKRPPRTNAPMQPQNGFKVPTPPHRPKPSELIQDLRSVMPEPPIHDYEHFMDTKLYDGMVKQSQEGENYLAIDCGSKFDEILLEEFGEWEVWIKAQGIDVTLQKGFGDDKVILLYWGEA
jgi:hypothetical protein